MVVLLLFGGRGKLSGLMGDAAKGIRAFRDGLKGDEPTPAAPVAQPLPRPEGKRSDRPLEPLFYPRRRAEAHRRPKI